jgi:hypothetical protein
MTREPLLLKASVTQTQAEATALEWEAFVSANSSTAKYQTNGNGMQPLRRIWDSNIRMETQLRDGDHSNPVLEWLSTSPPSSVGNRFHTLHTQLVDIVVRNGSEVLKTPSFINGTTKPGTGGVTHFDEYTNLATVILGSKAFFVAPPAAFEDAEAMGRVNERLGVDPLDPNSPNPNAWRIAEMEPGDVLLLPSGWWHFVVSEPRSVMTNVWF